MSVLSSPYFAFPLLPNKTNSDRRYLGLNATLVESTGGNVSSPDYACFTADRIARTNVCCELVSLLFTPLISFRLFSFHLLDFALG